MNFLRGIFKKNKNTEAVNDQKQFSDYEILSKIKDFQKNVADNIGDGEFSVTLEEPEHGFNIKVSLFVEKNDPRWNSMFYTLYRAYRKDFSNSNTTTCLLYEGILDVCSAIALENNINLKITEYSAARIFIDQDSVLDLAMRRVGFQSNMWQWR